MQVPAVQGGVSAATAAACLPPSAMPDGSFEREEVGAGEGGKGEAAVKNKAPNGKFICQEAMLSAWLPTLLRWRGESRAIPEMLRFAAGWCFRQQEYAVRDARNCAENDIAPVGVLQRSARWQQRASILLKAAEEIAKV